QRDRLQAPRAQTPYRRHRALTRRYSGFSCAQRLLMQRFPSRLQQSAVVVQASFSFAQLSLGGGTQTSVGVAAEASFARQKPSQHCTPEEHCSPFARQGASAVNARILPEASSWPGRKNAGWLGSDLPWKSMSSAATQIFLRGLVAEVPNGLSESGNAAPGSIT